VVSYRNECFIAFHFADHVEQFKQELNREVMNMTEEVGRLYREKQVVENQISDLFAFYTKQQKSAPSVSSFMWYIFFGPTPETA
jgi:hypothetical protein